VKCCRRAIDGGQHLGVTKTQLELEDTKKFENMLQDKIQELGIDLENSNTLREKEILVNKIDALKCVLDHLFNLKPGGDETQIMEIVKFGTDLNILVVLEDYSLI
jgi:hypothetical protein